ncbi:hypothetical protein [Bacillus thuringiensis]|uniref:hypothetical protein n=1 Tax=Bacillus thuringiensis TaxID=1428 RepID=UPI000BFEA828|nr:hypothetical protein [Bacillus thuringiensis]PGT89983.1 hypothetical protein COD17_09545 [Bacillus thuringiensis]
MFFQVTEEIKQKQDRFKELLIKYKNNEITLKEFKHFQNKEKLGVMSLFPSIYEVRNLCAEVGLTQQQYGDLNFPVWMS